MDSLFLSIDTLLPLENLSLAESGLVVQTLTAAGLIALVWKVVSFLLNRSNTKRLPPGPPGLPFIGNALQIYKDAWLIFTGWREKYGDLIYIHVANQPIIIINSHEIAAELLEKRANIYSSRPNWIAACDIMCGGLFSIFIKYNDLWRRMRRAGYETVNVQAAAAYYPIQTKCTLDLIKDLVAEPNKWERAMKKCTGTAAIQFTYGANAPLKPTFSKFANFIARIIRAAIPGIYFVDLFPWMRHLPNIIAPWKRQAEGWYKEDNEFFEGLYNNVKENVLAGNEQPCITSTLVNQANRHNLDDHQAAWLSGTLCVAGTDTTVASLMWFMIAMMQFPEVQEKAQKELDEVVGRDRLPTWEDRDNLVYLEALIREVLRWRPMVPLVCLPNAWGMNHDPAVHGPDVATFNPDRHLTSDRKIIIRPECPEGHVTFGFGKRICIGRYVAKNSLYIEIAGMLWALRLTPKRDASGKPILPGLHESLFEGLLVRPIPFDCDIEYRFPEAETIVNETIDRLQ
ncbi:hypothetical protein Clacol_009983 [Clathrus columnatus]|uniref:Cytochrome P450 n=1 Tax=Clathrus columnatus TaxID=1419009 RepID=A0AAV5AMR5_9AGAM|nr:hypothetical protein Clacol_009983 [Clathrus columnatus]